MDKECVLLLPGVCALLADSNQPLPDDTSLEKLLDRLTELSEAGVSLPESCPCLLDFLCTVTHNTTCDPSILSFALKLGGLMASTEDGFTALQERSVLDVSFKVQHWQNAGLWEDPCVRIGWIHGFRRMLLHPKALCFFVLSDSTKPLLQLQRDASLFVASAASQLLAHILLTYQETLHGEDGSMQPQYTHVIQQTTDYMTASLLPKDCTQIAPSLQVLQLLAIILNRAGPPLQDQLLQALAGSLVEVVEVGYSQLTPALMDVIMSVYSSDKDEGAPRHAVSCLLSAMLNANKAADLLHAAAAFLHGGHHDPVNTTLAVKVLLMPLHVCTHNSLLATVSAGDEHHVLMAAQLKSKSAFVSLICVSLRNAPQIALMPPDVLPCPPASMVLAVVSLLRACSGDHSSGCSDEAFRCLLASGKVQKCALEVLASLSSSPGVNSTMKSVFEVLIQHMKNPDLDPTVLHKSYKAFIQWMNICTSFPQQLREDLMTTVQKRVCDPRWEVRDSSVELLGQLAGVLALESEDLPSTSTPVLRAALQDPESYVRASVIAALARTLAPSWQQGGGAASGTVRRLLDILSEDTEGFARRAVVRYFISWFSSSPSSSPLLLDSVRRVLSLGSVDLDWEVKVHSLELAELLLDSVLKGRPGYGENGGGQSYEPACALHTRINGPDATLDAALGFLVDQGVIPALLACLVDCDRPVGLKASRLLISIRDTVCPLLADTRDERTAMATCVLPEEIRLMLRRTPGDQDGDHRVGVCQVLTSLDLDQRSVLLSQSSDHVHNSFLSLLQDIMSARAAHGHTDAGQEVVVDCY
ncbi:LOW QUALITY PROTEIN: BRCA1-associated ATM activator 1 [Nerophis ophidion]|uniref:LOW QUALITY PROTEIN: BRCA1-associated ATM activator 1 n=1 Tax=Nerophis ophidion TaxID=159077 RepID=UPI002ADF75A2|nr:LOW QUALITY PROTEIN: BRCA1-associated ATM activator 1 [Nerophis ophidion]